MKAAKEVKGLQFQRRCCLHIARVVQKQHEDLEFNSMNGKGMCKLVLAVLAACELLNMHSLV